MIERLVLGSIADKPHTVLKNARGELQYEECFTRRGFESSYSIAYHARPPMEDTRFEPSKRGWAKPLPLEAAVTRRLFLSPNIAAAQRPLDAHVTLLTNSDVDVSVLKPSQDDDAYLANNDGDLLYFIFEGSAVLETPFGSLDVKQNDYLWVPRSLPHRFLRVQNAFWLCMEHKHGLRLPAQYLNDHAQLKMDAPYSHRDFRKPATLPFSEERAVVVVKRQGRFYERETPSPLLDVTGLDGYVYPVAFDILRFQPKTGLVHLPPPVHATFVSHGALVCSFVPRVTDTHPQAIPCPYPHSSVDCDEMLFYCRGNFTSRKGVGPGAISLHPAGIPHGPHPGAYEGSIGSTRTDELAVMLDTFQPLFPTQAASHLEHGDYHASWRAK